MSITEPGAGGGWLQARIKNILFSPASEWDRIAAEPATVRGLYTGYACILAAIGPIAGLIGGQVFGQHGFFLTVRPSLIGAIVAAIVYYVLSLAGVFVLAVVIDILAPSFGGTRSRIQALKVAVYSCTAVWLFMIFFLAPPVSSLSVIGIYSLYLIYLGVPTLMKAPADKAMVYSVLSIAVALAILIVVMVAGAVVGGSLAAV